MMPELDGYGVLQALQTEAALARISFIFLTAKGEKNDLRSGMELGADDYLTKPVANAELVRAIEARLRRAERQTTREFKPDFSSSEPLLTLGLTPRAAEALLWLAQGKTNSDIGTILGITESTVKKHVQEMFEKLGVETRGAATVRALEVLKPRETSGWRALPRCSAWRRTWCSCTRACFSTYAFGYWHLPSRRFFRSLAWAQSERLNWTPTRWT